MTGPCGWSSCGQPGRPFADGYRCPPHEPATLAGRAVPVSATPYRPQATQTPLAFTIIDDRAIASARRASNPHERKQAIAREAERKTAHERAAQWMADQLAADRGRAVVDLALPEVVA